MNWGGVEECFKQKEHHDLKLETLARVRNKGESVRQGQNHTVSCWSLVRNPKFFSKNDGKPLNGFEQRNDMTLCLIKDHRGFWLENGLQWAREKKQKTN